MKKATRSSDFYLQLTSNVLKSKLISPSILIKIFLINIGLTIRFQLPANPPNFLNSQFITTIYLKKVLMLTIVDSRILLSSVVDQLNLDIFSTNLGFVKKIMSTP